MDDSIRESTLRDDNGGGGSTNDRSDHFARICTSHDHCVRNGLVDFIIISSPENLVLARGSHTRTQAGEARTWKFKPPYLSGGCSNSNYPSLRRFLADSQCSPLAGLKQKERVDEKAATGETNLRERNNNTLKILHTI